jgi:hypothetical protein
VVVRRRVVGGEVGAARRLVLGSAADRRALVGLVVAIRCVVLVGWVELVVAGRVVVVVVLTVGSGGSVANAAVDGAAYWVEDVGVQVDPLIAPSHNSATSALAK